MKAPSPHRIPPFLLGAVAVFFASVGIASAQDPPNKSNDSQNNGQAGEGSGWENRQNYLDFFIRQANQISETDGSPRPSDSSKGRVDGNRGLEGDTDPETASVAERKTVSAPPKGKPVLPTISEKSLFKDFPIEATAIQKSFSSNNQQAAVTIADKILTSNPKNPDAYTLGAWVQGRVGNREQAREIIKRGREIAPDHVGLQNLEKLFRPKASEMAQKEIDRRRNALLGTLQKEEAAGNAGDAGGARNLNGAKIAKTINPGMMSHGHFLKSRPVTTNNAAVRRGAAAAKAGLEALKVKDFKGAVGKLTQALRNDPKNSAAWRLRAMAFQESGHHKKAVNDASRAIRIDQTDHWAFLVRAKALINTGQMDTAQLDILEALQIKPDSPDAYAIRARLHHKTQEHDKELEDLRKAAELDPAFEGLFRRALQENEQLAQKANKSTPSRNLLYGGAALLGLGLISAVFLRRRGQTTTTQSKSEGIEGFDIIRKLGQGGMGEVWEAVDRVLQRRVAIKKLIPEIAAVPRERKRFLKEARTVAALKHPSIIEIHQVVESGEDLYLVFEHIDGVALNEVLLEKGTLSLMQTLEILRQTAGALDFAHGRGVIHQDLKPANIMVEGETVKVMDFGISRRIAETMGTITRMEVVGTPSYMAPEQAQGEASPETDIYALGATLYEMLSGRRPFSGMAGNSPKLEKFYTPLSQLNPDLPPLIDSVIDRALDPDPKKRFHSGQEFFDALEEIAGTPAPSV
ncbi:MAG: hypothetical protein COB53_07270 [Elusimicrobia bacterium]|nr:MAG: hypothetical protein COB53_07270 [Elusimicrobiota bacterium]